MRILTLDIETTPNEGYFWRAFKTNIASNHLNVPAEMLSYAAKWLGHKHVVVRRQDEGRYFLETLWELINQADAVVTYNGDGFDLKHINREFARNGFPPARPVASIDLYKTVKTQFSLPYNSLDYACEYFLGKRKLDTGGFELWRGVMEGNEAAWKKMLRYNKRDTQLTEELYIFLRPWIRQHPFVSETPELPDLASDYCCPACASKKVELHRPRRTRCFAIRQVRCMTCGNWFDGKRKKI